MPRANEPGGKYANGIIANTYTTNDTSILVVIDIQSYLGGYFEFRICPHNNPHVSVQQDCLNRHQLRVWDVFNKEPKYRYYPQGIGLQRLRVEIPQGMTCTQCVLQWKWHTGSNTRNSFKNSKVKWGSDGQFYDLSINMNNNSFHHKQWHVLTQNLNCNLLLRYAKSRVMDLCFGHQLEQ